MMKTIFSVLVISVFLTSNARAVPLGYVIYNTPKSSVRISHWYGWYSHMFSRGRAEKIRKLSYDSHAGVLKIETVNGYKVNNYYRYADGGRGDYLKMTAAKPESIDVSDCVRGGIDLPQGNTIPQEAKFGLDYSVCEVGTQTPTVATQSLTHGDYDFINQSQQMETFDWEYVGSSSNNTR